MEIKRLFDIIPYQLENFSQPDALAGVYNGKWVRFSTGETVKITDSLATGLMGLGIQQGDMVGIMSSNRPEWQFIDLATQKIGGISVPIYPTSSEDDITFICNHSEMKALFIENEELWTKIMGIKGNLKTVLHFYSLTPVSNAPFWESLKAPVTDADEKAMKTIQDSIKPDEMATIIYTSGTTGDPKGVMLSHSNIISNIDAALEILPVGKDHTALSFLPLSHIFERMINYMYMSCGISIYYAESMETIAPNLREIKPHVFSAVPRLLEKVFDKIMAGGQANTGLKLKLFNWAVKLALQWEPDGQNGFWYNFQLGLANKIVFKKIRAAVGGNVVALASGSAALQSRLMRFFNAAGIPLVEGYGLTETSPVISVGGFGPYENKVGYVGRVINGGEVKIAEDGEILYKGPNVMLGYYKRQDLTDEAIRDGWFHTGDIGLVDEDGFVKITDRKKEIFKTSGGKYIIPQQMENKYKQSLFIEQVMVLGEYQKFPSALIIPNFEVLEAWCKEKGIDITSREALCKNSKVIEKFQAEMDELNEGYAQYAKVKKFVLLPNEWTPDGGEITPTLKLKRKVILEKFKAEVERIYAD